MVLPRRHDHSHAVVLPALVLPQKRELLGIKETGVRIEHAQHARDGSLVDGLVHIHVLGVVVLNHVQHARKIPHRGLIIVRRSRSNPHIGAVNASQNSG